MQRPFCQLFHLFQSLLWRISLSNVVSAQLIINNQLCFNPCYDGLASQTKKESWYANQVGVFQSLLWWISLSNDVDLKPALRGNAQFQSLLWRISPSNLETSLQDGALS